MAALTRRRRRTESLSDAEAATLIAEFHADFSATFYLVPLTSQIIDRAMSLADSRDLRGYDAAQLATALVLKDRRTADGLPALTLISADSELNEAAIAEGLVVLNPDDFA